MVCVCVQMAGRVFWFEPFKRSKSINFLLFSLSTTAAVESILFHILHMPVGLVVVFPKRIKFQNFSIFLTPALLDVVARIGEWVE